MTDLRTFQDHDGIVHRTFEIHSRYTYRVETFCLLECGLVLPGAFVSDVRPVTCLLCLHQLAEEAADDTAVTAPVRRGQKELP
jgi:hypothetical protein